MQSPRQPKDVHGVPMVGTNGVCVESTKDSERYANESGASDVRLAIGLSHGEHGAVFRHGWFMAWVVVVA